MSSTRSSGPKMPTSTMRSYSSTVKRRDARVTIYLLPPAVLRVPGLPHSDDLGKNRIIEGATDTSSGARRTKSFDRLVATDAVERLEERQRRVLARDRYEDRRRPPPPVEAE